MNNYKVLIIGGHISPAVAVIEKLKSEKKWDICFVGRKYTFDEHKHGESLEHKTINELDILFIHLSAPRFPVSISVKALLFPFVFVKSAIQSIYILKKEKPSCVLSFGGYISAPVAVASWIMNIPLIIHEQTQGFGAANKFAARFAKAILISWKSTKQYISPSCRNKVILTGMPIRESIIKKARQKNKTTNARKTIYITGGSTGAHAINVEIARIVPKLINSYMVIHQCGDNQYNDFELLGKVRNALPAEKMKQYALHKYLSNDNVSTALKKADIIVSRAGANTVVELALLSKPVIFIPLAHSACNEQVKNAEILERAGSAYILRQEKATGENILAAIKKAEKHIRTLKSNAKKLSTQNHIQIHNTASVRVIDCIRRCIRNISIEEKTAYQQ